VGADRAVSADRQADVELVSVDSTSVRAHQDAAGMRMDPQVLDALEKAAAGEKGRHRPDKRLN
jgi:hypothetical protein